MRRHDRIVALLAVLSYAVFQEVVCCPDGWLAFDSKCIRIYSLRTSSYLQAMLICGVEGGILAPVSSENMLKFLAFHTSSDTRREFWVDGNTSEDEALEQHPWRIPHMTPHQSCYMYKNGQVQVTDCISHRGIICSQYKPMYDPIENCIQGLTQHSFIGEVTGDCVYRTPRATDYASAKQKCAENHARFLDLDEMIREGLQAFHEHAVMMNDRFKYWTDLKLNGSSVFWKSGEPLENFINFVPGRGECITVSFNFTSTVNAVVYQTGCDDHAYVVCAANATGSPLSTSPAPMQQQLLSCPPGHNWKVYNGYCFWETSFETSRFSWDDARSYCKAYGGDLASFHSLDEEKIGLSFQYGSFAHPYWIGLRLDLETETYKWSDGTDLDYLNWAPGHPNHQDKRLKCVSMNALTTQWKSSLCGILSWFICRVPKRPNPSDVVIPTPLPLATCESDTLVPKQFFFEGYCYSVENSLFNWHRAKEYCENKGSSLVSIHSDEEMGFLLRILYEDKKIKGNRIWIGLNTLRSGTLKWTDYSPVDYTYWNENEPNNVGNIEKCCSMYIGNGYWNDELCSEQMGFVCKQVKNATVTHVIPSTPDPRIGNCKKGWYDHHDRCYLPVGSVEKERVNWTEATTVCENKGGHLVSIRDHKEQAFLSFLMQGLHGDTWIGLHDTIHSGRYYWFDSSDLRYVNWAPGEPSFFGIQEDCVKMVYNDINSGVWQDDVCNKNLSFICYAEKDITIPKPNYNRGLSCIYPEGWLKLDHMCFQMFAGNPKTWKEAETACSREGAHLISMSGKAVQAVANYLGTEVNQTFWIGLEYRVSNYRFEWLNGWPISFTKWGKDEPSSFSSEGDLCYASTSDGYWGRLPCEEKMPFICQITTGKSPARKQYTGNCPKTSVEWKSTDGSYCHLYESSRADWFGANIRCFRYGSYLISIHSLEDLEIVRKGMKSDVRSVFLGLMRNDREGFSWTDQSPVDFTNWEEGQPENEGDFCVEMMADTLEWRVAPCQAVKHFICSAKKDQLQGDAPETAKFAKTSSSSLSTEALVGILVGSLILLLMIIGAVFFFRPTLGRSAFRNTFRQQSVSYENALYNVDSASMEFQDDGKDSL